MNWKNRLSVAAKMPIQRPNEPPFQTLTAARMSRTPQMRRIQPQVRRSPQT
jgi:hypothetical protein